MVRDPASLVAPPGGEGWGGSAYTGRLAANLLLSSLVGLDDRGSPIPDMAESVPTLENGGAGWVGDGDTRQLRVTFKLRRGARWSDGQPVTARDVLFSWQLALNPRLAPTLTTEHRYERVEAVDDATALFTLFSERSARAAAAREPNRYGFLRDQRGPVFDALYAHGLPSSWLYPAHALGPLVDGQPSTSPKAADLFTTSPYARRPIGSGPFQLQDWQPGVRITFAARGDYARGAPKVRTLVFVIGPSDGLLAALRAGGIDLLTAEGLDARRVDELTSVPGVRIDQTPSTAFERLDLRLDHPALNEPRVREALILALDRRALAEAALGDRVAAEMAVRDEAARRYPHDIARASALLDSAGFARGADGIRARGTQRLEPRLLTTIDRAATAPTGAANAQAAATTAAAGTSAAGAVVGPRLAELVREQLTRAGVGVRLEARPQPGLFEALAKRDFGLALYASVGGLDAAADMTAWHGSAAVPDARRAAPGENSSGLRHVELDRALAQAANAPEAAARANAIARARELLLAELPMLPLFTYPRVAATSPELRGVRPPLHPIGETWNAHEWTIDR